MSFRQLGASNRKRLVLFNRYDMIRLVGCLVIVEQVKMTQLQQQLHRVRLRCTQDVAVAQRRTSLTSLPPTLAVTSTVCSVHPRPPFSSSRSRRKTMRKIKGLYSSASIFSTNLQQWWGWDEYNVTYYIIVFDSIRGPTLQGKLGLYSISAAIMTQLATMQLGQLL